MKNPMNDDDYTSNDEQIQDLKDLVEDYAALLRSHYVVLGLLQIWYKKAAAIHIPTDKAIRDGEALYQRLASQREGVQDSEPLCTCGHTLADHEHPDGNHQGCRKNVDGITCKCDGYEEVE